MRIFDVIRLAFKNLFRRKGRTMLTILGILVGSVSVMIMISMGLGLDESKKEMMAQFSGLENIEVYRNYNESGQSVPLNDSLIAQLEQIEHVQVVTPIMNMWDGVLVSGKMRAAWVSVIGIRGEAMKYMEEYKNLKAGDYLKDIPEVDNEIDVVVGYEIPYLFYNANRNFDYSSYYDDYYSGESEDTRTPVIDIFEAKLKWTFNNNYGRIPSLENGAEGVTTPIKKYKTFDLNVVGYFDFNYSTNEYLVMDIEDMKILMEERDRVNGGGSSSTKEFTYDNLMVKAEDMKYVSDIQKQIQEMGLSTYSYMTYVEPLQEKIESDQFLFLAIGCIAFFVAALNIINTMLMSTYERTREIGIMKVLGCKIRDIRNLFLLEASLLGFVGGVCGVPVSYLVSYIINYMQSQSGNSADMGYYYDPTMTTATSSIIPPWLCLVAILFSVGIGFLAGLYPSIRAMRLSALDAIKNE